MIKKYREFIFEDEDNGSEDSTASTGSTTQDPAEKSRFEKFKEFLNMKSSGASTGSSSGSSSGSELGSAPKEYTAGSGSFSDVDKMISIIVKYLNKHGITNPIVQKAILATIGKESGFTATKEASYKTTSPARIRQVFGSRFAGMSDEEINRVKQDDTAFWDKVYGGEWGKKNLGNIQSGDGAKYLGRGFNGITGRANYKTYTDMLRKAGSNIDLISNPEILEKSPEASAEVNALYFINGLSHPLIRRKYGNSNPNDFKDFDTALKAVVNANAGAGTDITRGFAKVSYDAAIAANNKLASKFDKAVSGSSGDTSRIA
jgi:putative chitinase